MFKYSLSCSILLLFICFLQEACGFSDPYENLNKILVERCGEDNYSPSQNLKEASNYWYSYRERPSSALHPLKMAAIETFMDLEGPFYYVMCHGGELNVISSNEKRSGANKNSVRHVEKVIYKIAVKHAEECFSKYPAHYRDDYSKELTKSIRDFVGLIWNGVILSRENLPPMKIDYKNQEEFDSELKRTDLLEKIYEKYIITNVDQAKLDLTRQDMRSIYRALEYLIKHSTTPDDIKYLHKIKKNSSEEVINEKQLNSLLSDYVFKSCKSFIFVTGPDLFEPAQHDANLLRVDGSDLYNPKENLSEINHEFYWAWAQYRICKMVTQMDQKSFLKNFIEANF